MGPALMQHRSFLLIQTHWLLLSATSEIAFRLPQSLQHPDGRGSNKSSASHFSWTDLEVKLHMHVMRAVYLISFYRRPLTYQSLLIINKVDEVNILLNATLMNKLKKSISMFCRTYLYVVIFLRCHGVRPTEAPSFEMSTEKWPTGSTATTASPSPRTSMTTTSVPSTPSSWQSSPRVLEEARLSLYLYPR